MGVLQVNQQLVTPEIAERMCTLCPFGAISYREGKLEIDAGCKMCKLCVKKGVQGVITFEEAQEEKTEKADKTAWNGLAVFAEQEQGVLHPVVYELIGKAKQLAKVVGQQVYAVLLGDQLEEAANQLLSYGVDKVFCYEKEALAEFQVIPYANALEDFIRKLQPSVVMVGATVKGRSLAPRTAARFRTGLTADCTVLDMKENTDLIQIRPAFGGNIMAQIVTPDSRPQFCTVRYKVFDTPAPDKEIKGSIEWMQMEEERYRTETRVVEKTEKAKETDIADAEVIIAAGRGVKSSADLAMLEELAEALHGQVACTRPLIEAGWFDARKQIGLSGRTVKPRLLIAVGISGSVQFAAGMKGAECIIAVNSDADAEIFQVAHYGFVGDLYEILPRLLKRIKGGLTG